MPRLPPTKAARSSWKSRPVSAVVVLLPFVPVMATTGTSSRSRQASSTSPTTGTPARRAAAMPGSVSGTPGETTTRSAEVKSALVVPAQRQRDGEPLQRRQRLGELGGRAPVGDGDPRSLPGGEARGRGAAARQPDHQHLLPGEHRGTFSPSAA